MMFRTVFSFLICVSMWTGCAQARITAVVFDFGGVVATVDHAPLVTFLMDSFPISLEESNKTLASWIEYLRKERDDLPFWKDYAASLGVSLPEGWLARFEAVQACAIVPYQQTLAAVKRLQEQGYRTGMLSNVIPHHAAIIQKLGYYDLFDPVLLSCDIGVKKPDPKAYQLLLEKLALPPEEVLFIDDQNVNVEAARKLGIHAIHFIHPECLESELHKEGVMCR